MQEEPIPQAKSVIPTPDVPQSPPPPAMAGTEPVQPADPPPAMTGTAGVNVKVREAADSAESGPEAGSIAPFNTRIIAALIDGAVAAGLLIAAMWILPHFAVWIARLLGIAYLVTRDSLPFLGGQSVGKKAMKLKAVTMDGKSLVGNWEPSIIRNVAMIVFPLAVVEFIILLTREGKPEHGRRLGDEWAKTKVILAPDPPAAG